MDSFSSYTFIYSTDTAYLSVEADVSKNVLKVGCLGMGPMWGISDHTWDYALTPEILEDLLSTLNRNEFEKWDECYFAAYEPGLQWDFIVVDQNGEKRRSFGEGMKAENLDAVLSEMKDLVMELSKLIYINLSELEAVYYCHVANKVNLTCTIYRNQESEFERTGIGERKFTLDAELWKKVAALVDDPSINHFGFGRDTGSQFLSIALYLSGKMVSYTYGGTVDIKWDNFENRLMSLLPL